MTNPNVQAGSAHLWFFEETSIVDWQASIKNGDAGTGENRAKYSIDCLPMVSSGNPAPNSSRVMDKNDYYSIAPEQQLNALTVKYERDTLDFNTQFSSKPVAYSRTGLNVMVEVSIADISLRNLALAFGIDLDTADSDNRERLSLTDRASELLPSFGLLIIPQPFSWFGDSSINNELLLANPDPVFPRSVTDNDIGKNKAINWRNSWIYLPQATVVEANPRLVYGVRQQQEITVSIMGTPDLRPDRSISIPASESFVPGEIDYTQSSDYANFDRALLGYPTYKQLGEIHNPDILVP